MVEERLLSEEECAQARLRYENAGGAPDTAVLETRPLAIADRERMLRLLSRLLDTPVAPAVYLEQPDEQALSLVPDDFAASHGVVGVHARAGTLTVVGPPLAPHVLSDLARRAGRHVEPYLALELDARLALAAHGGAEPDARFAALEEALRTRPPAASSPPPIDVDSGWGARSTGPLLSSVGSSAAPLAPGVSDDAHDRSLRRLRRACSSTEIRDAIDAVGRRTLSGVRVFLWREGERLSGLAGAVPGMPKSRIRAVEMEVDTRTILGKAATLGLEHAGPVSDPSLVAFYAGLGREPPRHVLVEPVRDGALVVGVFVGDNGDDPLPEAGVAGIRRVLAVCGLPLGRLAEAHAAAVASPVESHWDDDLDTHGIPVSVTPTPVSPVEDEAVYDAAWEEQIEEEALGGPTKPMSAAMLRQLTSEALEAGPPEGTEQAEGIDEPAARETVHEDLGEAPTLALPPVRRGDRPSVEPEPEEVIDPMGATADLSGAAGEARAELISALPRFKSLAARDAVLSTVPDARVVDVTPGPEAIRPVDLSPTPAPAQPTPVPERPDADAIGEAVGRLAEPSARAEAIALLRRGEDESVAALASAFPGPLVVDRYAQPPGAVPIEAHSGVLAAMVGFGATAVPTLEALCDHLSPEIRYYAVLCFDSVRSTPSLPLLTGRLFDSDPTVRDAAVHVLGGYRDDPHYPDVFQVLRRALESERSNTRRIAAEMTGRLHVADAVPVLANLLAAREPPVVDAAHRALVEITRQDFGFEAWMWIKWYERNADRPRAEWLIEALVSDRRPVRAGAFRELRAMAREDYGYAVDAPPAERARAAERWSAWWSARQRGRVNRP